jgi:septal ring factor EnvC (AmiA/AmiB activator)
VRIRVGLASVALGVVVAVMGCSTSRTIIFERFMPDPLTEADQLLARGQYEAAVAAYDAFLQDQTQSPTALLRARATRDTVLALLDTRAQLARLEQELAVREGDLARAREDVARRDGDLGKVRQEVTRLAAETERLRQDIERLKQVDIRLERRR